MAEMSLVMAIGIVTDSATENMIESAIRLSGALEHHQDLLDQLQREGPSKVDPVLVGDAWTEVLSRLRAWSRSHRSWSEASGSPASYPFLP